MGAYSAYNVAESAPATWRYDSRPSPLTKPSNTTWRPGEELAASGFVAIVFYLFLDINIGIYRIFKKKQGLYYWCMLLGTWGCLIDAIAVVLKWFLLNSEHIWPLYTLFVIAGWTIYAPAQLLVLYSRLHLVNQSRRLQRCVLILIISASITMIIPSWVLDWQAFNPYNSHISALYSPREAIIDRCTQLGYTFIETIVSGIYIFSLTKLLTLKSSVRQRRVMMDLIYINVIAISLDILTVVLVFLNQLGISHPVQTFSYIVKLKLEFIVLNQLMAVAARGLRKESFAERRYHQGPLANGKDSSGTTSGLPIEVPDPESLDAQSCGSAAEIELPSPTLSRAHRGANGLRSTTSRGSADGGKLPTKAKVKKRSRNGNNDDIGEDTDEEIGVHMWEKHGKLVMKVPWFKM